MAPRLNHGFSTGSGAAAAAKAAALLLCRGLHSESVDIPLPDGSRIELPLHSCTSDGITATASVRKDGGDDPDITTGLFVFVTISINAGNAMEFCAGEGVGTVTLPGLSLPVGEAAINPGPRRMIEAALREISDQPFRITVSIPGGREIALKTFNPKLGILGGLSILGTTGIVRPYSLEAVRASLLCGLDVSLAAGITEPVFVPGNLGAKAASAHFQLRDHQIVEAGNEWEIVLGHASKHGITTCMLLGHPGKLAKLWMGEWDTHSSRSPMAVHAVSELASVTLNCAMPELPTVEGVFQHLDPADRLIVGNRLSELIATAVQNRFPNFATTAIALTNMKSEIIGHYGDLTPWS